MNTFTINDIRSWGPCYDPGRYLPEDWSGTALDILNMERVPIADRLWVVLREECIDARTLRLFAVRCARRALSRIENPDPRSLNACNVAERYANGEATDEELAAARAAAWAAWDAAWDAASKAAWSAAWAAVSEAAWAAAWAARDAAWAASDAARAAASDDARHAEREAQRKDLIELLKP